MFILVFGNGNAGAEAANTIFKITSSKNNIVKYYYEYPPHHGWHFTKELETTKYIDSKNSKTELIKLMEKADLLFSCGWVHKISANITNQKKCYNLHPSLLPLYRGKNTIERQISNKENLYGITLHMMDERYDTGPIFEQISFFKANDCSPQELVIQNIKYMKILLADFFNNYPKIKCIPQNDPQIKEKTLIHL